MSVFDIREYSKADQCPAQKQSFLVALISIYVPLIQNVSIHCKTTEMGPVQRVSCPFAVSSFANTAYAYLGSVVC